MSTQAVFKNPPISIRNVKTPIDFRIEPETLATPPVSFEYPLPQSNRRAKAPGLVCFWFAQRFASLFVVRYSVVRYFVVGISALRCCAGLKLSAGNAVRPHTQLAMPLYCVCVLSSPLLSLSFHPTTLLLSSPLSPATIQKLVQFQCFYISARRGRETAAYRAPARTHERCLYRGAFTCDCVRACRLAACCLLLERRAFYL